MNFDLLTSKVICLEKITVVLYIVVEGIQFMILSQHRNTQAVLYSICYVYYIATISSSGPGTLFDLLKITKHLNFTIYNNAWNNPAENFRCCT